MGKVVTNKMFLDRLSEKGVSFTPIEEYKGYNTKIKFECKIGHIFESTPHNLLGNRNCGCPICSNHQVLKGYNDMWTTNPEMAKMLLNPEHGHKYTDNSTKKLDWVCPNCGNIIRNKTPNTVYAQGLCCPICKDGISFPEKFMSALLNQLNVKYYYDKSFPWSNGKRFDFYLPDYNVIIETHGLQHYVDRFGDEKYNAEKQSENDNYKMVLAQNNGIDTYIQVDCRESNLSYIQNSVLDSKLHDIFDLRNIDWNKCMQYTTTSRMMDVINDWNTGNYSLKELAERYWINQCTVSDYLKRGNDAGFCDYSTENVKKIAMQKVVRSRLKPVVCVETGKIYKKIVDVEQDGISSKHIATVCKGKRETAGGFHWRYA